MTEKTCFHCGLEVPEHLHLPVKYENEEHDTCCAGCQAVAQSIIDAGLGSYYQQRTADAARAALPDEEILAQLKLYDLPEIQSDFVEQGEGSMKEGVLMLSGITCAACVWLIEQQLLRLPGVQRVDLNYSTHRVRVVWDDSRVALSDILLRIQSTGYTAAPYDAKKVEERLQKERKQSIIRLAVAGLCMMQTMMFAIPTYFYSNEIDPEYLKILHWGGFIMALPVIFYCAVPFYKGALRDFRTRRPSMDTPITIAVMMETLAGLYSLSINAGQGLYFESISMLMFFLLGGRFLEQIARRKAGDAAERLVKLIPAFCHRVPAYPQSEQTEEAVVARLQPGDVVLVKPGEVIPVDGTVLKGSSEINEAMLTGESLPVVKQNGDKVVAGTINAASPLLVRTDSLGSDTRLSHIVKMLDRALAQKPRAAELAEKYASKFIGGELLLALPVFFWWWWYADFHTGLWITVALLVMTCPCALSLATPTSLAASTGALVREGVLICGKQSLETLARVDDVVFDKTGTLTAGELSVSRMVALGRLKNEEALALAQALEAQSEHPIAQAILRHEGASAALPMNVMQRVNRVGHGVSAQIEFQGETQVWALGRAAFVAEIAGSLPEEILPQHSGSMVFLGNQSGFQTAFLLEDSIKEGVAEMIADLQAQGMSVHLLSGDRKEAVGAVAEQLGIGHYRAEAVPEDKLAYVSALQQQGRKVMMVGDGINDAPVLVQADVSAAVSGGADVARDGADVVLLKDDMRVLPLMISQAKRTARIINQNLSWASAYNLIAVPLAVCGFVTPLVAVLGMSFSSMVVMGNSLRLLKIKKV